MEGDEVEDGEEEYGEEVDAEEERIDDEEDEEYYEEGEMRGDIEEDSRPSFDRDPESLDGEEEEDVTYEEDEEERLASSSTRHRQQQQARQSDSNDDIVIVEDDTREESSAPPALQRPPRISGADANVAVFAAASNLPPLVMTGSSASPFATPGTGGEEERGLSSSTTTHRESASRLIPPDSEDCKVPSTPTLIPHHQSSSVSSHVRVAATTLGASSGSVSGHVADVSSPSVPHTPLDADDATGGSGNAAMAPARFVFGSAASVQSDLAARSSGSLQSSLMDRFV